MSTLLSERPQPITAPVLRDRVPAQHALPLISARQEAAIPPRPRTAPRPSLILEFFAMLLEWHHRRLARHELGTLDARMLRDVGLDPGTVYYEASQSFWRAPRDWRN
jgi:uncharacterized protein YjiS (DUF1127 family)